MILVKFNVTSQVKKISLDDETHIKVTQPFPWRALGNFYIIAPLGS